MPRQPVFIGLVSDENGSSVETVWVGGDPFYVVDDAGFRRHVPSEQVDRQVLEFMHEQIKGHEEALSDQTAKMLGQDDIFSRAMILNQLKAMESQFEKLLETGIPEDARAYLGMMGFQIVINVHGEVVDVRQPSAPDPDQGDE